VLNLKPGGTNGLGSIGTFAIASESAWAEEEEQGFTVDGGVKEANEEWLEN
jgi:hypothetical protein